MRRIRTAVVQKRWESKGKRKKRERERRAREGEWVNCRFRRRRKRTRSTANTGASGRARPRGGAGGSRRATAGRIAPGRRKSNEKKERPRSVTQDECQSCPSLKVVVRDTRQ